MEGETSPVWAGLRMVVQHMHKICRWNAHTDIYMAHACWQAKMDSTDFNVVELAMKNSYRNNGREYTVNEKLVCY